MLRDMFAVDKSYMLVSLFAIPIGIINPLIDIYFLNIFSQIHIRREKYIKSSNYSRNNVCPQFIKSFVGRIHLQHIYAGS